MDRLRQNYNSAAGSQTEVLRFAGSGPKEARGNERLSPIEAFRIPADANRRGFPSFPSIFVAFLQDLQPATPATLRKIFYFAMKQKQIILVTGATGAQGGSVARALLDDGTFAVRALTRNPESEKALALRQAGVEVVRGDMDDPESLNRAMQGAYGVFGVTSYWEHFDREYRHGKNLIDAVQRSDVRHFIFSSLPSYKKLSGGALSVPHYDIKAELEEYAKSLHLPATFVQPASYYENFLNVFMPRRDEDGNLYFGFPQGDTKLAMTSVEDLGGVVKAVFRHPAEYIGRVVGVVGDDRTFAEYTDMMSRVLGRRIYYVYIPHEEYAGLDFPGAEEIANMFEVRRLFIPEQRVKMIESYALNPSMQPFERWLAKNKNKFAALLDARLQEAAV